jgi:shikimate kinase
MNEFKPCPFCGKTPTINDWEFYKIKEGADAGRLFWSHSCHGPAFVTVTADTVEEIREIWNGERSVDKEPRSR